MARNQLLLQPLQLPGQSHGRQLFLGRRLLHGALCKEGGGGAGSVLSPAPCATPQVYLSPPRSVCQPPPSQSQSRCCDTAHLDLLHITDQLLHLVLQPLVPLLGGLLGTQPLSQLQGETGIGGSQSG